MIAIIRISSALIKPFPELPQRGSGLGGQRYHPTHSPLNHSERELKVDYKKKEKKEKKSKSLDDMIMFLHHRSSSRRLRLGLDPNLASPLPLKIHDQKRKKKDERTDGWNLKYSRQQLKTPTAEGFCERRRVK